MASPAARTAMIAVGVLAVVGGGVWIGQGLNLIPGSFMTGDKKWFVIGVLVAVVGIVLLVLGIRRRVTPPSLNQERAQP